MMKCWRRGPQPVSGYQKLTSTLHIVGVIATPNCFQYPIYTDALCSGHLTDSYIGGTQFFHIFSTFLTLVQCGVKWPSILLGGTFEKR